MTENDKKLIAEIERLDFPRDSGVNKIEVLADTVEYLDASTTLEIRINFPDGWEQFAIISFDFLTDLGESLRKAGKSFYTLGQPVLMVEKICAANIRDAVLNHLEKENLRYAGDELSRPALRRDYVDL